MVVGVFQQSHENHFNPVLLCRIMYNVNLTRKYFVLYPFMHIQDKFRAADYRESICCTESTQVAQKMAVVFEMFVLFFRNINLQYKPAVAFVTAQL